MSNRQELESFIALQRLLDARLALQRERKTPPAALAQLRARFSERDAKLAAAARRRGELAEEQAGLERDVAALYEEREHFRKQKTQVTNMRQLTAVVSALDHVDVQLKEKEERLKGVWEELEGLNREVSSLEQEGPEEREVRAEAEAGWEERRQASEGELEEVERRLREVQRAMGPEALGRFKKLWTIRKPLAVVPTVGQSCSACHAELRPALFQLVRTGETLETCESCRRVLYDPEKFPVS